MEAKPSDLVLTHLNIIQYQTRDGRDKCAFPAECFCGNSGKLRRVANHSWLSSINSQQTGRQREATQKHEAGTFRGRISARVAAWQMNEALTMSPILDDWLPRGTVTATNCLWCLVRSPCLRCHSFDMCDGCIGILIANSRGRGPRFLLPMEDTG